MTGVGSSHAGPKPRKMSAISRAGRHTSAARHAGGSFVLGRSGVRRSSGLVTARMMLAAACV